MRRFLRWLLGVPQVIDWDEIRIVTERIVEIHDKCLSLERRFTRLQGEVSRAWRDRYEELDDEEDEFNTLLNERRQQRG